MTDTVELDALWDEFHSVVNMTSQELAAWLRAGETGETAMGSEPRPGGRARRPACWSSRSSRSAAPISPTRTSRPCTR